MARTRRRRRAKEAETIALDGPPCPRCRNLMHVRSHGPGWEPIPGRAYYSRWYRCANRSCPTTEVMPKEFKIDG
jgi:hypothetical protein